MRHADDPLVNYKDLVQRSYDRCAAAFAASRMTEAPPELDLLIGRLDDGAAVLDIGCGAGVPITRALAERFAVTGVDISNGMIRLAQANVRRATFIHADVTSVDFPASSFDAAIAFYTLFHIPREEHRGLFQRIHDWLKPGGYLMCTLSHHCESAYVEDDFFGETMYWSNYDLVEYEDVLTGLGFKVLTTTAVGHGYSEATVAPSEHHPLVLARKQ